MHIIIKIAVTEIISLNINETNQGAKNSYIFITFFQSTGDIGIINKILLTIVTSGE